ncbi:hypothetical protein PybrP1_006285 [[Pythium] brassicae (nom. inval.)]|nr:hypothetical protein PybrP1_006285 [[Pythium] brassicae (nom. inval.)]
MAERKREAAQTGVDAESKKKRVKNMLVGGINGRVVDDRIKHHGTKDVTTKISTIESSFKYAVYCLGTTDAGIENERGLHAVVTNRCLYFYELLGVMSERASIYLGVDNNGEIRGSRRDDESSKSESVATRPPRSKHSAVTRKGNACGVAGPLRQEGATTTPRLNHAGVGEDESKADSRHGESPNPREGGGARGCHGLGKPAPLKLLKARKELQEAGADQLEIDALILLHAIM